MVYASREATRKAIRYIMNKRETENINVECSHKDAEMPKRNEKAGIHWKYFKNANGASLLYK